MGERTLIAIGLLLTLGGCEMNNAFARAEVVRATKDCVVFRDPQSGRFIIQGPGGGIAWLAKDADIKALCP